MSPRSSPLCVILEYCTKQQAISEQSLPVLNVVTCVVPTNVTQSLTSLEKLEFGIHHRCLRHLTGHTIPQEDTYGVQNVWRPTSE